MKLQTRIIAGYLVSSGLIVMLGVAIFITINQISPVVDTLRDELDDLGQTISQSEISARVVAARTDLSSLTRRFADRPETEYLRQYELTSRELAQIFERSIDQSTNADEAVIFRNLLETAQNLEKVEREIFDLTIAGKAEQARALVTSEDYVDLNAAITHFIGAHANSKLAESGDVFSRLIRVSDTAQVNREQLDTLASVTAVSVAFIFIASIVVGTLLARSISRPVTRLTEGAIAISEGDFGSRIGLTRSDEIGQLAAAFDRMTETLEQTTAVRDKRTLELKEEIIERNRAETQLLEAKELADQANEAKSLFLLHMSHELRTPLNAIMGFTDVMYTDPDSLPEQKKHMKMVLEGGRHLLQMIHEVLDFSRLEAGESELQKTPVVVADVLQRNANMFKRQAQQKDLSLTLEVDRSAPQIAILDEGKLSQVLINLLGNAVKYTDEGDITLSARMDKKSFDGWNHMLHVSVEDTGRGIPQNHLTDIFEPFKQVIPDGELQEGTGLGLAITHAVVKLMEGTIAVESRPGKGTTFSISIPVGRAVSPSHHPETATKKIVKCVKPTGRQWSILVVEDDIPNQMLLETLLKNAGFQVTCANNGAEAVAAVKSSPPEFIWMDIRMPVMDGNEATRQIRQLPAGRDIKIVALSADVIQATRTAILDAGCDGILTKPVDVHKIFAEMGELLELEYKYY